MHKNKVHITDEDITLLNKIRKPIIIIGVIILLFILTLSYLLITEFSWFIFIAVLTLLACEYYFIYHISLRKINRTLKFRQKEILQTRLLKKEYKTISKGLTCYMILPEGKFLFEPILPDKLNFDSLKEGFPIKLHYLLNGRLMYVEQ